MAVESADVAEQVITGRSVGVGTAAFCTYCKATLREGDELTVYAYRCVGEQLVSVARLYCSECKHRELSQPTCGCFEWLAEAHLAVTSDVAQQTHHLTLAGVTMIDQSAPERGTEP
jgi:hypothetical protein